MSYDARVRPVNKEIQAGDWVLVDGHVRTKHKLGTRAAGPQRCYLLSIAQKFHVTQCFGEMSHCSSFCTVSFYLMLSHVLDFGGTL